MPSEKDYLRLVMVDDIVNRTTVGIRRRTAGLTPASEIEKIVAWLILLTVSASLYVHLELKPFLPIHLNPGNAELAKVAAFFGLGISLLAPMALIIFLVYDALHIYVRQSLSGSGCVICAECGACTPFLKYFKESAESLTVKGCKKCGSKRIYCAKCGKSSDIYDFVEGGGCPHCGYPHIMAKRI